MKVFCFKLFLNNGVNISEQIGMTKEGDIPDAPIHQFRIALKNSQLIY